MDFTIDQVLQRGIEAHKVGKLQEAERLYRLILQKVPKHPDANHNLGVLAVSVNKADVALPLFKMALEANPNQRQFWISYIETLIKEKQFENAKNVLEQGKKLGLAGGRVDELGAELIVFDVNSNYKIPETTSLSTGVELREAGRYKEAEDWLKILLSSESSNAEAWSLLSQIYILRKKDVEAEQALSRALEINSELPSIYRNQARLLLKKIKPEEALAKAQFAYERSPEEPENLVVMAACLGAIQKNQDAYILIEKALRVRPNYAEAFANRSLIRLRANDIEGATKDAEMTVFLKPHLTQVWALLGSLRYLSKNIPGAIDALAKAHDLDPSNVSYMVDLGEFFRQEGEVAKAIAILEKATKLAHDNAAGWINLGTAYQEASRNDDAKMAYENAFAITPRSAEIENLYQKRSPPQIELNILLEHYKNGRYDLAQNVATSLTQQYPNHPFGWKVLSALYKQIGKLQDSLIATLRVLEISPNDAETHSNLGITLQDLGRPADAEVSHRKAIAIKPEYAGAHYNLGNTLKELGRLENAESCYSKAITIKPEYAEAHNNLGITLQELGRLDVAEASFNKAIAIKPDFAEAHNNLGNILNELSRLEEAETSFNKAIAIKPDLAEAHHNLGNVLRELGRLEGAETSYKKAIAIKPDYVEALTNLGNTLKELSRLEDAVTSYKKAIEIKPDLAEAYSNLGITLQEIGRPEDAETSYKKAIAIKPDYAEAHSNLGNTLRALHRYAEAIKFTTKAIQLNTKSAEAQQAHSVMLAYISDYKDVCKFSDDALLCAEAQGLAKTALFRIWETRLYTWIYHPDLTAEEICAEHIRWGSRYAQLGGEGFAVHDRLPGRRLRIGYVSPDFRQSTCRFYFEPLFSSHDHTRFEVFAYSNVVCEDEHTERMKTYFDGWRNILGLSDEAAAQLIRKDKIDILIDGCGHMNGTRLLVFAHKPAPIQVTWLGSAWTTGLPQMDYVLFDPYMAPQGTTSSEKIVHLPRTWAAFRPGERAVRCEVKPTPAVENGYVTFGYSGRTERLNHRVFHAWGRILKRLPQARLVLDYKPFNDPKTQTYYREFLEEHGVDTTRVVMRNSENIFEGLGDIDILLDSFPHSGGTMLFDALWMGVPAVTLASSRPVGRIGTSLMSNLGLPEWVAQSEQGYEDKAVAFAQDIAGLASLRGTMRARMQGSPVMDERAFARDVESTYEMMWRTWLGENSK